MEATPGEEKAGHLLCCSMVSVLVKVYDGVVPLEGFRLFCHCFSMPLVWCQRLAKVDRVLPSLLFDGDSDSAFQEGRTLFSETTRGSVVLPVWLQAALLLARALKLRSFPPCWRKTFSSAVLNFFQVDVISQWPQTFFFFFFSSGQHLDLLLHNGTAAFQPVHQPCWECVCCGRVSQGKAGRVCFVCFLLPSFPAYRSTRSVGADLQTYSSLVHVRASAVLEMFVQHNLFCSLNFSM